jgi:hypothetical protein
MEAEELRRKNGKSIGNIGEKKKNVLHFPGK